MLNEMPKLLSIRKYDADDGLLQVIEDNEVNIPIKRVFWITDVAPGQSRGCHAHKQLWQVLVMQRGHCRVIAYKPDGSFEEFFLTSRKGALIVPPLTWLVIKEFACDSLLLVLASDNYKTEDYINNYDEFKAIARPVQQS